MEFDFKSAEKLADDIFNAAYVLDYFCTGNIGQNEPIDYILPLIKYIKARSSKLDCMFINFDYK